MAYAKYSCGANWLTITVHPLKSSVDFRPGYTEQAGVEHVWQPPFNAGLYREQGERFRAGDGHILP
jgi:hypothetical protein